MTRSPGWQPDPFGIHEERYLSADGSPTKLVRDGGKESYDPPPEGSSPEPLTPSMTSTWADDAPTASTQTLAGAPESGSSPPPPPEPTASTTPRSRSLSRPLVVGAIVLALFGVAGIAFGVTAGGGSKSPSTAASSRTKQTTPGSTAPDASAANSSAQSNSSPSTTSTVPAPTTTTTSPIPTELTQWWGAHGSEAVKALGSVVTHLKAITQSFKTDQADSQAVEAQIPATARSSTSTTDDDVAVDSLLSDACHDDATVVREAQAVPAAPLPSIQTDFQGLVSAVSSVITTCSSDASAGHGPTFLGQFSTLEQPAYAAIQQLTADLTQTGICAPRPSCSST